MDYTNEILSAKEVFSIWGSEQGPWSNWVKPALFASIDEKLNVVDNLPVELPEVLWYSSELQRSALILDLPADQSVWEALALLKFNYQPIPLFNCCHAPGMVIDVQPIVKALWKGAKLLKIHHNPQNTLPVFLLDNNRLTNAHLLAPGKFDNRWCIVPQDMPSSNLLKSFGIKNVCLRTTKIENDIAHILKRYQMDGMEVSVQNVIDNRIRDFSMSSSLFFKSIWYRIQVLSGFKRNSAGGFGAIIPMPSSSGGHG